MKKTFLWLIVVVLFFVLPIGLYADNSPPDVMFLEECVLDVPSQLNPQLALIGNEFMILYSTQTIVTIEYDRAKLIDFLCVSLGYAKVESSDRTVNLGQNPDQVYSLRLSRNVDIIHSEFG